MSKKKKRREDIKEQSSFALLVDNSETTSRGCAKCIGKVLDTKGLGFASQKLPDGRILFLLRSSYRYSAYDKGRNRFYPVIPLDSSNIEGNPYWLAVSLIFASALTRHRLEEVRLFVFRGSMSDPEKEAFFRAEWCVPTDDNRRDAQPHWHVYRTLQDKELGRDDIADFQPLTLEEEVRDFGEEVAPPALTTKLPEEKEVPFEKFHFAMASSWHLNAEHQKNFETEQSLFDWLSRCINYIRGQFKCISLGKSTA